MAWLRGKPVDCGNTGAASRRFHGRRLTGQPALRRRRRERRSDAQPVVLATLSDEAAFRSRSLAQAASPTTAAVRCRHFSQSADRWSGTCCWAAACPMPAARGSLHRRPPPIPLPALPGRPGSRGGHPADSVPFQLRRSPVSGAVVGAMNRERRPTPPPPPWWACYGAQCGATAYPGALAGAPRPAGRRSHRPPGPRPCCPRPAATRRVRHGPHRLLKPGCGGSNPPEAWLEAAGHPPGGTQPAQLANGPATACWPSSTRCRWRLVQPLRAGSSPARSCRSPGARQRPGPAAGRAPADPPPLMETASVASSASTPPPSPPGWTASPGRTGWQAYERLCRDVGGCESFDRPCNRPDGACNPSSRL